MQPFKIPYEFYIAYILDPANLGKIDTSLDTIGILETSTHYFLETVRHLIPQYFLLLDRVIEMEENIYHKY